MSNQKPTQLRLLNEETSAYNASGPITCLGMTFESDDARRAYFTERLREHLQDPNFRAIEGFPIGEDEDILALSDPPYYTACPNPFLPQIMEEWQQERAALHAELGLRDEEYHREPFASDVSEGKNNPIYSAHSYHTKVPHKAIMRYILHYTEPGDIVFDGFCGTGMTGVAAQLCGDHKTVKSLGYRVDKDGVVYDGDEAVARLGARKAVLNDLSPAATFIAYNYNTPVDSAEYEKHAKRILKEVKDELGWMYKTFHEDGKNTGNINYMVWSEVFLCSNCGKELVFWKVAVDQDQGKILKNFHCPYCDALHTKRNLEQVLEITLNPVLQKTVQAATQYPVFIKYSNGKRQYTKYPDHADHELIEQIQQVDHQYWYPTTRIDRNLDLWFERDYRRLGIYSVDAFFSKRNLYMLAALWSKVSSIKNFRLERALEFTLTGMQVNLSRMNRWRPNVSFPYNPLSGTLYIGTLQSEANVIVGVNNKISRLFKVWSHLKTSQDSLPVISTQSTSQNALGIPTGSLDYIFVDPPFGSNIIYSDLSIIWESWLRLFTEIESETVVHRRKKNGHTLPDYQIMMTKSFKEMYNCLKAGRWMTIEFHNTKNAVWMAIQEALSRSGFVVADVRVLDKGMGSFKQVTAQGATKQDLIISSYKPTVNFERKFLSTAGTPEGVWNFVRMHLEQVSDVVTNNGVLETIAERQNYLLFDRMVAYHIQCGLAVPMGAAQFYAGLEERFAERDGMYFLHEQVAEYDKARLQAERVEQLTLFVSDEKSAITWLRQQLDEEPQTFQQIQPRFLRELHQASHEVLPDLGVMLEQNFLQDDEGRWYVPDPNRAGDLEKLRIRGLLREFETYKEGKTKLKQFRTEAVRTGFKQAWAQQDYRLIVQIAERLPERVLQEDPDLLMYYDNASLRT